MLAAGTAWLEKLVPEINALNVYPVPDADCGTNMLLTMRAALSEAEDSQNISSVAQSMARGALMGARGNSGVILSQIYRGLDTALSEKSTATPHDIAHALQLAANTARHALTHPVDGTILTVADDAAAAACWSSSKPDSTIVSVIEAAVDAARDSVVKTPELLPVLKEAGVVDAGGHGYYTLLEGALHYLKNDLDGQLPKLVAGSPTVKTKPVLPAAAVDEPAYGFCTQFLIAGKNIDQLQLRRALQEYGNSLIVVGDSKTVRVHIHTPHPSQVTALGTEFGDLMDIDIRDMDEQHRDFILTQQAKTATAGMSVVAVASGEGLINILSTLGVGAIVPGGQSMNPSIADLLQAVEAVPSQNVVVLPNNKNIILTARQLPAITKKHVEIIPTESIPQGIAALVGIAPEGEFETNLSAMKKAIRRVKTIEVTRAVRNTRTHGIAVREGQYVGLLDGKLDAAADNPFDVIEKLVNQIGAASLSIANIYFGAGVNPESAEMLILSLRQKFTVLEIAAINGGQSIYDYVISLE